MNLSQFITKIGDEKAARLFNVTVRTAAAWRRHERQPRPKKIAELVAAADGQLSYESIYQVAEARP